METIKAFKQQQEETVNTLEQLLFFLQEGKKYGVKIDPRLEHKLETGIKSKSDEKLKVALIGGFSEGKTSIAAAWAERYDKNTMKINQQESSDKVEIYSMEDFELIDTPGLFGFKETEDKEKYKDITKKYISEAHLILYVMNPNNPIKESHKEELIWLFKELNLLPRTIFVLSRFDEEVDIEDEEDYNKGLEVKRQNIIGRLKDFAIITDDDISIVAISANPYDEGIEYWLANPDRFKKLSHINSLQKATTDKIKSIGSKDVLIEESKKSIIRDVLQRELPRAIEKDEIASYEYSKLKRLCDEKQEELNRTIANLNSTKNALRQFVTDLFTDLILQAKGTTEDTIVDFFERNIGDEGIVLETNIQNEFERQLGVSYNEINRMQISLNESVQQYNSVVSKVCIKGIKAGGEYLKNAGRISNVAIKNARDFVMPSLKFKPWETIKITQKINSAFPIIGASVGVAFEVWDSYNEAKRKEEFNKLIANMVRQFEQQRKEYVESIKGENFIKSYFPNLEIEKQLNELYAELQKKQTEHENFKKWRKQGEAIEAEYVDFNEIIENN